MLKGFLTESYYITLIRLELDGRGHDGVSEARDWHERARSGKFCDVVIDRKARQDGREQHERDAHGRARRRFVQPERLIAVQERLPDRADQPADPEGIQQIFPRFRPGASAST